MSTAVKIQTNGWNLMKLFAHFLDTQIQLGNQKSPHGNPFKKGSFSENAMKKDEGVIFQPFHRKINRRALRWDDLETSAELLVFELQHFL